MSGPAARALEMPDTSGLEASDAVQLDARAESGPAARTVAGSKLRAASPGLGAAILAAYLVALFVALARAAHDPLFFSMGERGGQGIDFFCVPKAYANLLEGRSAFDTWGGKPFGPHSTWFVLHPAVALWVGGYLSSFSPWVAYVLWVATTLGLICASALLFAHHARSPWRRLGCFAVLLCSPLTYLLLDCGNVHGLVLLAAALLLVGLYELRFDVLPAFGVEPQTKVAAGLLLSLLSKPVLVLVVPALLLVRATRRAALWSLLGYALLSLAFLVVPVLNPESVGLSRIAWLVVHPHWVREQLNVYRQHFVLVPEMLDNAMHWLHMVAQSDYLWDHVQIFSLPVLLKGLGQLSEQVPTGAFRLVALLPFLLAPLLLRVPHAERPLGVLWLVVLALAIHFLGY
ncbi:MAG TPA: hypothetical protein VG963_16065, partial [Polyangiaceae bacterium]|nr:hypothetical protein [Polyangiaceae bacterium]